MDFSFGIITGGGNSGNINLIIDSIESMKIGNYEIIIIGGDPINRDRTTNIAFEEDSSPARVSEKKNLITDHSNFENVVYLHDYISFCDGWYEGFVKFGNDFNICLNPILGIDGSRYRDWCLWMEDAKGYVRDNNYLIPYTITHLSNMMYVSGAYWVAKKNFMTENRINDQLRWGQGEDIEWSIRVRSITDFKINTESSVKLLKQKDRIFNETTYEENEILRNIEYYKNENSYKDLIEKHIGKWIKN